MSKVERDDPEGNESGGVSEDAGLRRNLRDNKVTHVLGERNRISMELTQNASTFARIRRRLWPSPVEVGEVG